MRILNEELQKFWAWAQLSPEEYQKKIHPRNPDAYSAEWETEYPAWIDLELAFKQEILVPKYLESEEFIKLIVFAIAIDNESEILADFAAEKLDGDAIEKVFDASLQYNLVDAQWQLVSRISKSSSKHKVEYLHKFLNEGGNDYVKERAQYNLEN